MYASTFPPSSTIDTYLRQGRMINDDETIRDMINRVVTTLAEADARVDPTVADGFAERLGRHLDEARIVFSTPIMTNAGRYADRPLAACAVPPVDLRADLSQVKTVVDGYHRAGMGTGFNLNGLADPVGVLRFLNEVAVTGAASGREDRPVGNMAILALDDPHAAQFIDCKVGADDRGEPWKFNISLHVTDQQMRAALDGPCHERELLRAAADAAYVCADPGLVFADRMDEGNPTPHIGQYVSTAPCAEVGLVAGETCQFGYVNLGVFHTGIGAVPVDLDALAETVRVLVRALDDAIEASLPYYPSDASVHVMRAKRKIGVGVCGLADLLVAAELPYDSDEGRRLAQEVLAFINYTSKLASVDLAADRGACPAVIDGESRYADAGFLERFAGLQLNSVCTAEWADLAERVATTGMLRNSSTVAIPPTGRSAPVVSASTGIEPLFRLTDPRLASYVHPGAFQALTTAGRKDLLSYVINHGRLPEAADLPARLAAVLATATQIPASGHLAMAAAVQACVDEAVSKTVNLPSCATVDDVFETYAAAWEAGCKGITVYVDGSRHVQPKAL